jgi:protocatechuate 3,4-dioxygenase beta subunit
LKRRLRLVGVLLFLSLVAVIWILASGPGRSVAVAVEEEEPPPGLVAISGPGEPGEKLQFWGRVLDYRGRPLEKAAVVAYHTDRAGLYNPPNGETRVPRLRGVAVTDSAGRFGFSSIRPAPYPAASEPAHIHLVVSAPAHHVRHLEYWFEGDPLVTAAHRQRAEASPSLAIVDLRGNPEAGWTFRHDIRLEGN